jgi:tetratricopeptide (TPR) repeat protein
MVCGALTMVRLTSSALFALCAVLVSSFLGLPASVPAAEGSSEVDQALALNDVTGDSAIEGEIQILVKHPEDSKKLLAKAAAMAKQKNQPFNYNAALIMARAGVELKEDLSAAPFYQICLEHALKVRSKQKILNGVTGLLKVYGQLYRDEKYEDCVNLCQSALETLDRYPIGGGLKTEFLRGIVQARTKQGRTEEASRLTESMLKANGGGTWRDLELKAWLQREMGNYEEAAKTYVQILASINKDKSLEKDERNDFVNDVHYILSNVYMEMNQVDKAGEQLQILLKEKPNDPTYNNDLGYIWADHDKNLDQAEAMIRKAIDEDKKQRQKAAKGDSDKVNAAYLDSLGWVLFKQKKYQEARPILIQAVQDKEGQHVEIFDHLGDLHMALGEKAEAIAAWKKGIEVAGPTKREQERKAEVQKKLKKVE